MSQVRVSTKLISGTATPAASTHSIEVNRVLAELPDQGKWSVLLPLAQRHDGLWSGFALDARGESREWLYCAELGLRLSASKSESAGENHEFD